MTPHIEELKTRITHTLKRHDVARADMQRSASYQHA